MSDERDIFWDCSRRQFIKGAMFLPPLVGISGAASVVSGNNTGSSVKGSAPPAIYDLAGNKLSSHEAMFYEKKKDLAVECHICPRQCQVASQERGYCGVRANYKGTYHTLVYSLACALNIDPIEKKPLFHFMPGTMALSVATAGCNMMCKFCQNWQISQTRPEQVRNMVLTPNRMVAMCKQRRITSIAFTYSEPVVFYEYMHDTAMKAKEQAVKSVMISNGYIQKKPMVELTKYLTAVKVDFKAYTEKFYWDICRGHLKDVLQTLVTLRETGIWFELVYLVVPTLNDDLTSIRHMADWIVKNIGSDVPLHFSRFYPQYQLKNLPPTPIERLESARHICLERGIHYVYIGNVPGHGAEHTYCPKCGKIVIKRRGYTIQFNHLSVEKGQARCSYCQQPIPGVWS